MTRPTKYRLADMQGLERERASRARLVLGSSTALCNRTHIETQQGGEISLRFSGTILTLFRTHILDCSDDAPHRFAPI